MPHLLALRFNAIGLGEAKKSSTQKPFGARDHFFVD
jgi:hypothetical protein